MICSKCGKESVDTATFCIACGKRLSFQKPMVQEAISQFPDPANKSLKRFKPISATPNLFFIVYLLVAFPLNHLMYLEELNADYSMIGLIYGNLRTFTVFFAHFIGWSIPPLIFLIIYNCKIGEGKFKTVSITVTIIFILLSTFATLNRISSRDSHSKLIPHENKEKEIANSPADLRFSLSEEKGKGLEGQSISEAERIRAKDWLERGIPFLNARYAQAAIEAYTQDIELDPKNARNYNNRGIAYKELGDYRQAIRDYNRAIELDPKLAAAYCNRGNAYGLLGDYRQAIGDHDRAIELDPKLAGAYNNRGITYGMLGNQRQEIMDRKTAARLGSEDAQVWLGSKGIQW